MRSISSLSLFSLGVLSSWQMFLFWAGVYILVFGLHDKRKMNLTLRNALLILLCFVNYTLFQLTIGYSTQNAVTKTMINIVEQYSQLPAIGLIVVCVILTIIEIFLYVSMKKWYNTHITSASIKEMIETLPVGICAFESNGKVTLRNRTMEQLCRCLTGLPLLNGNEFFQILKEQKEDLTDFAVSLPDYGVWTFERDDVTSGNDSFTLLIAYNVTEAYQKTQMLADKQKTVEELSEKLIAYNKEIENVTTQQEILNAKIHIHDELGLNLLAIKHYLVSGGNRQERSELLEHLKENIKFLQQDESSIKQDEYSLILTTAKDLGITVRINGDLPQNEPTKHIVATAIHECFTNIIRHTDGDTLYVSLTENEQIITVQLSDNNSRPVGDIAETGGLRSLRDLIEHSSGKMKITTEPNYYLTITLQKENEKYGL